MMQRLCTEKFDELPQDFGIFTVCSKLNEIDIFENIPEFGIPLGQGFHCPGKIFGEPGGILVDSLPQEVF